MNQPPERKETDAIRSDIDSTRARMDSTIDALEQRLKGRHLLDEVLGFLRPKTETEEKGDDMTEKLKHTAGTAARAAIDVVRTNPVPSLLIGAGVAWMIYQSRRPKKSPQVERGGGSDDEFDDLSAHDLGYDIPETAYPSQPEFYKKDLNPRESRVGSKLDQMRDAIGDKIAELKERLEDASSKLGGRARETAHVVGERANEMYVNRRDQVVGAIAKHPLEVAAGCLVAGMAVGLCLPTAEKVEEMVGPTGERLRRRAREASQDLAQRGKRVVEAATNAMREEAEHQGLTPEALRKKADAVVEHTREATAEAAEEEGISPPKNATTPADLGNESGSSAPPTAPM